MKKTVLEDIAAAVINAIKEIKRFKVKPLLIAVEGRCASGKTTLASALQKELGCCVFHMDDFFLRPEQRTRERLLTAGGNIDYERFKEEVLEPLNDGAQKVSYRAFDCKCMSLCAAVTAEIGDICVCEGSYSCHPQLWQYYDLRIFLSVDKEEQIERIVKRNGVKNADEFREKWIPLEEMYFSEFDVEGRCEMRFRT